MTYEELMVRARQTNEERDEGERAGGFAAPGDDEPSHLLQTAMSAVECGIRINDWNAIAEGQAMLEKLLKYVWWMEAELKTIDTTVGGCATWTTSLYQAGRQLFEDTILESDYEDWELYIERNRHGRCCDEGYDEPNESAQ